MYIKVIISSSFLQKVSLILVLSIYLNGIIFSQELQFFRLDKANTNISNQGSLSDGSILKDSLGFIWIATVDGLNRWNGYEMKIFRPDRTDSTSIVAASLSTMEFDKEGTLWIGSFSQGIMRYYPKKEVFDFLGPGTSPLDAPDTQINTIRSTKDGKLWIGTEKNGLFRYDFDTESFIPYPLNAKSPKYSVLRSIGGFKYPLALLTSQGIFFPEIHNTNPNKKQLIPLDLLPQTIEYGPEGRIWMGFKEKGEVYIYNTITNQTELFPLITGKTIDKIHYDGKHTMWIGSRRALYQYDLNTKKIKEHVIDFGNKYRIKFGDFVEFFTEENGGLWYMTRTSAGGYAMTLDTLIRQPQYTEILKNIDDLKGSHISNYLINKSNYQDILGLPSPIPEYESLKIDRTRQIMSPVFLDTENNFWFFEFHTKKMWRRSKEGKVERLDLAINKDIEILDEDNKKRIWSNVRLAYFDLKENKWKEPNKLLKIKGLDTISSSKGNHLCIRKDGSIALATNDEGVYIYNPLDTTLFHLEAKPFTEGKLSSNTIPSIYEHEKTGEIYMSTRSNINIWNPIDSSITYLDKEAGISRKFLCMVEDENSDMWLANASGIVHMVDDSVVSQFSTEHLNRFRIKGGSFRDNKGNIYHNHIEGPYTITPGEIQKMSPPSNVIISDFFIDRKIIHPTKNDEILSNTIAYNPKLKLNYKNNNVGFEFGCINGRLKRVKFYYQLKGLSDTWQEMGSENTVHFTNLDPGNYTIRVKALSAEGRWSEKITTQDFTIKSPWYATWFAYLLYFLVLSSLLYGIYRYRINQLLRYQSLRTRISSDLHDDVGSLLSSLAWQTEVIKMTADEDAQEKFSKVSNLSRTAMERMRDTVWAIDSQKDDTLSLIDRMTEYLAEQFENRKMSFKFDYDDFSSKDIIAPDIRQNVYLIFKEAVVNALKHSNGDLLTVQLHRKNKILELVVMDNGKVEEHTIKKSGLGLSNMKMRAKRINGELTQTWNDGCHISLKV